MLDPALNSINQPAINRIRNLESLLNLAVEPPKEWLSSNGYSQDSDSLDLIPCELYKEVRSSWQKAQKWTSSMDTTLCFMLAITSSTCQQGDQLWGRIIGRPGSAKSTLCEACSTSWQYTYPISLQRGFHSGWRDKDTGEDVSLLSQANEKTIITKDGDTLLSSPGFSQILGEGRDIYDGTSRSHYRNAVARSYAGLRLTWIIAGTKSLRRMNKSYLGDRFLDCVIYDENEDDELEAEIVNRASHRAARQVLSSSNHSPESRTDERMTHAMKITGGYLNYLRENINELLAGIEFTDEDHELCQALGTLVSFMRARPDKEMEEEDENERELPTRLTSQFVRLLYCYAAVLNKTHIDDECKRAMIKIAHDTCSGITYRISRAIYESNRGLEYSQVEKRVRRSESTVKKYLSFMREIEIVRLNKASNKSGARGRDIHLWRLSKKVERCMDPLYSLD
jgi:predicted transcriptional regulator